MHISTRAHTHTQKHATRARAHTHTHTYRAQAQQQHTLTHTHNHAHTRHTPPHLHTHTYRHTYTHACIHAYTAAVRGVASGPPPSAHSPAKAAALPIPISQIIDKTRSVPYATCRSEGQQTRAAGNEMRANYHDAMQSASPYVNRRGGQDRGGLPYSSSGVFL